MEKSQFEVLMMAISGLKSDVGAQISGLRDEMNAQISGLRDEMTSRFNRVEKRLIAVEQDTKVIRGQTASTCETVADLSVRVAKLEGPNA